ncbi:MAG: dihydroorotate dehydrogenase [Planctomycetota bacterium]
MPAESAAKTAVDLSVDLAGLKLANPIMTASGTSGYGPEYAPYVDLRQLGAFVTKSVTLRPRKGSPPPRTVETASGMLNAIGLANVGLECFVTEKVPFLRGLGIPTIVNVAGHALEDYVAVCRRLDEIDVVSAVELNVSCPNVADGLEFGTDPERLRVLVRAVRRVLGHCRLIVKLSPNVTSISGLARAAIDGGAEVLSLVNTLRGLAIDAETRRPILANVFGGLSGPAIKPVALAMVYEVYRDVARAANVPLIGMGGVQTWRDVVEFHLAGATAVAVGTATFVDPTCLTRVLDGLRCYLQEQGLTAVQGLIGAAHPPDGTATLRASAGRPASRGPRGSRGRPKRCR